MEEKKLAQNTGDRAPRTNNNRQRRGNFSNRKPRNAGGARQSSAELHLYPLGGLGEVGKNMTVYECNGEMIIVDCGLVFPDDEMFGIDLVIPDFSFIEQNIEKIKGIVITHGQEDHIGSLPYLLRKVS